MAALLARAPCDDLRVAVLVSGGGSNLQALLDDQSHYRVQVVLSNRPGVRALSRARARGVAAVVVDHKAFLDRPAFEDAMLSALRVHDVEVVVLAGFMRVLTPRFLDAFPQRVVNVHPALLPSFPGLHGARQALAFGARVAGCTVHLVDSGVDTGPILAQASVPVHDDDNESSLQKRIQVQEHLLLPRVINAYALGQVVVRRGAIRCMMEER